MGLALARLGSSGLVVKGELKRKKSCPSHCDVTIWAEKDTREKHKQQVSDKMVIKLYYKHFVDVCDHDAIGVSF